MTAAKGTTPMLEQYWRLKQQHPGAFLFFRLGDFYELFDEDARIAAPLLDLQLTSRDGRVAMCGVPYHAGAQHARRLLDCGFTVAIAEQVEDPALAKGLVDRQIVRVLTPGTVIPDDDNGNPRLGVWYRHRQGVVALAAELSTGTLHLAEAGLVPGELSHLTQLWSSWQPQEYLSNADLAAGTDGIRVEGEHYFRREDPLSTERRIAEHLGLSGLRRWGLESRRPVLEALAALARYLHQLHPGTLPHLKDIRVHDPGIQLHWGSRTQQQLDISASEQSLLTQLDYCGTKMGSRRLADWLGHPLTDAARIQSRLDAVSHWVDEALERDRIRAILREMGDLSRRVSRVSMGQGTPRDVSSIRHAAEQLPQLVDAGAAEVWPRPEILAQAPVQSLVEQLDVLAEPAPVKWDDTPLIRVGVDADIDQCRQLLAHHRDALLDLEEQERARSGIKSLRVGFHRTFGYYLEVTKSQAKHVPEDWYRRQTTTHTERFASDSLKELEISISQAEERLKAAEQQWAGKLQQWVAAQSEWLVEAASWAAELDALSALAEAAIRNRYQPPELLPDQSPLNIEGLRHPVLESLVDEYVKSSLTLGTTHTTLIVTGPNMGGKSTFMRALAHNVILAQCGSWVAAERYQAPIFDAVLTRIGADDDLVRGQSTFMVEMEEVAAILSQATPRSLVLLDELGRGTSTYDGMAIAHAVIERLADREGPLTLCATHYHELTALADANPNIANLTVEVLDSASGPVFTHRVVAGRASQSYGIEVARLAGLPPAVLRRAQSHLKHWEGGAERAEAAVPEAATQITFDNPDPEGTALLLALQGLTPDDMSPREAWLWIAEWKQRIDRGAS